MISTFEKALRNRESTPEQLADAWRETDHLAKTEVRDLEQAVNALGYKLDAISMKANIALTFGGLALAGLLGYGVQLGILTQTVTQLDERVAVIEERVTAIEERLGGVEDRVAGLEQRMARVEGTLEGFRSDVLEILGRIEAKQDRAALDTITPGGPPPAPDGE